MDTSDATLLAGRVLGTSTALLLLPGALLLRALRVSVRWDTSIVLAFALSYSWVLVLSIAIPLLEVSVDFAAGLTVIAVGALALRSVVARSGSRPAVPAQLDERPAQVLVAVVAVAAALAGWTIEPPFTGEEALDLISISRFADGGAITFENLSPLPDTRSVYLVHPYQLALGMVARLSGTDPLVALLKFRAFLAPLTLVLLYSLLRFLTPTRNDAGAAFAVVLLFIVFDMNTWEENSMFPFVRRSGMCAGACVPALIVLCLVATRRASDTHARRVSRLALVTIPVMWTASLATHALEMFTLLFLAAGLTFSIVTGLDRAGAAKQALLLFLLLLAATGVYITVQARAVPYVAEYDEDDKRTLRTELATLARQPLIAIAGGPTEARELLSRTIPATSAVVMGIPALSLAALHAPSAAVMLATGILPLALLYASPAGYIVLTLLTSVEAARDVNAYFALLGILALSLGLTALAHVVLRAVTWRGRGSERLVARALAGSLVIWLTWTGGRQAVESFAARAMIQPEVLLSMAVVSTTAVLIIAAVRTRPVLAPSPLSVLSVLLTGCLSLPFAMPEWGFGGIFTRREAVSVIAKLEHARSFPPVRHWSSYYDQVLKHTVRPPLPVPVGVIEELRRRIPPRRVVLSNPSYSCALVALLDAYCVNPARIYGHYFQPAARYHAEHVTDVPGSLPAHPLFNSSLELTIAEERLLKEYSVSYLLADPVYARPIAQKLRGIDAHVILEMDRDGYQLYRIATS